MSNDEEKRVIFSQNGLVLILIRSTSRCLPAESRCFMESCFRKSKNSTPYETPFLTFLWISFRGGTERETCFMLKHHFKRTTILPILLHSLHLLHPLFISSWWWSVCFNYFSPFFIFSSPLSTRTSSFFVSCIWRDKTCGRNCWRQSFLSTSFSMCKCYGFSTIFDFLFFDRSFSILLVLRHVCYVSVLWLGRMKEGRIEMERKMRPGYELIRKNEWLTCCETKQLFPVSRESIEFEMNTMIQVERGSSLLNSVLSRTY